MRKDSLDCLDQEVLFPKIREDTSSQAFVTTKDSSKAVTMNPGTI